MKTIILDTNFLLVPIQFHVDIFSEIERICVFPHTLAIIDKTKDELEKIISLQKGKDKQAASFALQCLEKYEVKEIETADSGNVDDLIVELVDESYIVATADAELKRRVTAKKAGVIVLRQKNHLEILNH